MTWHIWQRFGSKIRYVWQSAPKISWKPEPRTLTWVWTDSSQQSWLLTFAVARNEFESGEGSDPAQSAGIFFADALHFLALKVQLVIFVSAFVMVSTVWWFLVGCSTHGLPSAQSFLKVGATCPRALWSRRQWTFAKDLSTIDCGWYGDGLTAARDVDYVALFQ